MSTHYTMTVEFRDRLVGGLRRDLDKTGNKRTPLLAFITVLRAIVGNNCRAMVRACIASACASQTVACAYASAVSGTDTLVIAGKTLTARTVPANENEFAITTTDTLYAAAIAAVINANSVLQKIVRASSSGATLTVTCLFPGPIGNLVTLAETGNSLTLGGALLANGASDEMDSYQLGYTPTV